MGAENNFTQRVLGRNNAALAAGNESTLNDRLCVDSTNLEHHDLADDEKCQARDVEPNHRDNNRASEA